jgi:very-short-patch-repair endonuclease
MGARVPLPIGFANSPFHVAHARRSGVTLGRLRGADLASPFRGVRVPDSIPLDLLVLCAAYAQRMRQCEVFSHRTAAALHGLPTVAAHADGAIDVAAAVPHGLPRARGVRGHRVRPDLITVGMLHGLRVVSPVDAWCQLAAESTERELIVMGDALVRRQRPLATMAELRRAVDRMAGRRGHRRLKRAHARVRARTDSPAETELRLDLMDAGLPEPAVNVDLRDARGALIAIGDLVYAEYRILVEYDGDHHRTDRAQYARDIDRLDDLAAAGWRVIRFNASHVGRRRVDRIERVREALVAAGWQPAPQHVRR